MNLVNNNLLNFNKKGYIMCKIDETKNKKKRNNDISSNNDKKVKLTVKILKEICKKYKIRCSGKKQELIERINKHELEYNSTLTIQRYYRGYLIRKYFKNIEKKCNYNNTEDFYTLENFKEIPLYNIFTFEENNFIYAFKISSILKLISSTREPLNPYTRKKIPYIIITKLNTQIKLAKTLSLNINLSEYTHDLSTISKKIRLNNKIVSVFSDIDQHGFITDADWLINLSHHNCIVFIKELYDIWNYRAQILNETKYLIYPYGNPFRDTVLSFSFLRSISTYKIKMMIVNIINKLINTSVYREYAYLGCTYVLCSLTLVCQDAAESLPYLYYSVA
jgi:hypothetical protein